MKILLRLGKVRRNKDKIFFNLILIKIRLKLCNFKNEILVGKKVIVDIKGEDLVVN